MLKYDMHKNHFLYYFLLGAILISGLFLTSYFGYNRQMQMLTVTIIALLYVAMGIVHHFKDHSISLKIVLEYVAIAMLGMSIVYLMTRIHI